MQIDESLLELPRGSSGVVLIAPAAVKMDRHEVHPQPLRIRFRHEIVDPADVRIRHARRANAQAGGFQFRPAGDRRSGAQVRLVRAIRLVETEDVGRLAEFPVLVQARPPLGNAVGHIFPI